MELGRSNGETAEELLADRAVCDVDGTDGGVAGSAIISTIHDANGAISQKLCDSLTI